MPPKLQSLAPAPHDPSRGTPLAHAVPHVRERRQRPYQLIACNACRARKVACGGEQPSCRQCVARDFDCVYRTTRHEHGPGAASQLERTRQALRDRDALIQVLRTLPEDDAVGLLNRLRSASDLTGFISAIQGNMHTNQQPSIVKAARGIVAPAMSEIELELMLLHQSAYPKLAEVDLSSIRSLLLPYLSNTSSPGSTGTLIDSPEPKYKAPVFDYFQPRETPPVEGPSPPQRLCDHRLHLLQISYWSRVPITNEYAALVISFYLETDHPFLGFFDADLFIQDLVGRRMRHCSAFLVSSLLFLACQSYSGVDIRASALAHEFYREAEFLRYGESISDSIITVSSLLVFSIGCLCSGREPVAQELTKSGRGMAERLGLFSVPPDDPIALELRTMSPDQIRMASHVAWGTFNWLSMLVLYYPDEPILFRPSIPAPGEDRDRDPELWPPHHLPPYMGHTFPAVCHLWTIAQEVATVYFADRASPICDRVPVAFAEAKYQSLLAWMDSLGTETMRMDDSPAHVVMFHIWFHVIVFNVLNPFIHGPQSYAFRSFEAPDSYPRAIYIATINQLKQLIFWYHSSYQESRCNVSLNTGLVMLCYAVLEAARGPDSRDYLLLCISCWQELYVCFPIFRYISQGFLSMALERDVISGREGEFLMAEVRRRGQHHDPDSKAPSFTSDFRLAMTTPAQAGVDVMARKFEGLVLLDEFTTGGMVPEEVAGEEEEEVEKEEEENIVEKMEEQDG